MNKFFKRFLCLLLTLCLTAVLLAGCGGKNKNNTVSTADMHVYKMQETPIDYSQYFESIGGTYISGDYIYVIGYNYDDTDYSSTAVLLRAKLDGTEVTQLSPPLQFHDLPAGTSEYISGMFASADGKLYSLNNVSTEGTDENGYAYSQSYYLNTLNEDCSVASSVELQLSDEDKNSFYPNAENTRVLQDGTIVLPADSCLFVISPDGQQKKIDLFHDDGYLNGLFLQNDGTLLASYYDYENWQSHLAPVDLNTGKFGTSIDIPTAVTNNGGTLICDPAGKTYLYNDTSIMSFDQATGTTAEICNWLDSDIDYDSSISGGLIANADGSFTAIGRGQDYDKLILANLTYVDPTTLADKTILTLGCMYSYQLRSRVLAFNRASDTVRIKLVTYDQYNTEESNWTGGTTQFNTDIVSGNVPDIVMLDSSLPCESYMEKGLFVDLYPLIDADPDIERTDLLPSLLKASEYNGKLYQLIPTFGVFTMAGAADTVGSEMGWTMDDFNALLAQHPEATSAFGKITNSQLLYYSTMLSGQFVDYAAGTCNFDNDDFVKLLEYANTYPSELTDDEYLDDKTQVSSGTMLLTMSSLFSFTDMRELVYTFNGPITFKGFPSSKDIGSVFVPNMQLCISSTCSDQDAAWQFIRYFLSDEFYASSEGQYILPARIDTLQAMADKAMLPPEQGDGNIPYSTYSGMGGGATVIGGDGDYVIVENSTNGPVTLEAPADETTTPDEGAADEEAPDESTADEGATDEGTADENSGNGGDYSEEDYWSRPLTQAEVDQILALLNGITNLMYYDDNLTNIVSEEAASYFSGSKSAADVAAIIQNRVQTYISESR